MLWFFPWLLAMCMCFVFCRPVIAPFSDESESRAGSSPKQYIDNDLTGAVSPNAAHYPNEYDGEGGEDELILPQNYIHCCPLATRPECQSTCATALKVPREIAIGQLMDSLQREGCDILLHDPLTQCLMTRSAPRADSPVGRVGQDAVKLHCCELARGQYCQRLCHRAFSTDWAAAALELHEQCLSNANETGLASCLDEVDWPCSERCSGRDFCSLEGLGPWFRSCNVEADTAARMDVAQWQRDGLVRTGAGGSPLTSLPLPRTQSSSPTCSEGVWRSLACLLHTRPCDPRAGSRTACHSDCVALVTQCVDWLQVTPGFSAKAICGDLTDSPTCVPLRSLLSASPATSAHSSFASTDAVKVSGCSLGDVSAVRVDLGTVVRLASNASAGPGCPRACVCGPSGLESCVTLPCSSHQFCRVGSELLRSRQTVFRDCLVCSCSLGKLTCVQRWGLGCARPGGRCRCATHYMPVCGRNGRTYRNPCLAACAGLPDAHPGPCRAADPCAGNPCPGNTECIPARRLCLSLQQMPCPQHECVPVSNCNGVMEPACDTLGEQHVDPCALRRAGRTLAYLGPCLLTARKDTGRQQLVCGADGETYPSEEAALVARVPVEFPGPCGACGVCEPGCDGRLLVPAAGSCCPLCVGPGSGVLHAALSVKELDRALLALGRSWYNMDRALTLGKLLEDLQQVVLEDQCRVLGFFNQDDELVVILKPLRNSSACGKEAERLAGQFEQSGARLQAFMLLSAVEAVDVLGEPVNSPSGAALLPGGWNHVVLVFIGIQAALNIRL